MVDELRSSGYVKGNLDRKLELTNEGKLYFEKVQARPKLEVIFPEEKKEVVSTGKLEKKLVAA